MTLKKSENAQEGGLDDWIKQHKVDDVIEAYIMEEIKRVNFSFKKLFRDKARVIWPGFCSIIIRESDRIMEIVIFV